MNTEFDPNHSPIDAPSKTRNQKLWIGLIVGIPSGVIVSLIIMGYFPKLGTMVLSFLLALFILLAVATVLLTWHKEKILKFLFGENSKIGTSKSEIRAVYDQIGHQFIGFLVKDLPKETREKAKSVSPGLLQLGIWAFTRNWALRLLIAVFTAIGGLLGVVLLYNQNLLLQNQNALFEYQNQRVNTQTLLDSQQTILVIEQTKLLSNQNELVFDQNNKIERQSMFMNDQNILLGSQNEQIELQNNLLYLQDSLLQVQNNRIDQQTNLLEADRRSSLIFLLSNIMDKIDNELKSDFNNDSIRNLSDELIGRVIALSLALKPYKYLEGDTLVSQQVSPERGQLLLALVNSNLDEMTYDKIFERASFKNADLREAYLANTYLQGADLEYADLSESIIVRSNLRNAKLNGTIFLKATLVAVDLSYVSSSIMSTNIPIPLNSFDGTSFQNAVIFGSDLVGAQFKNTNFDAANLMFSDFSRASFKFSKGIKQEQLRNVLSLNRTTGIDPKISEALKKSDPNLFEDDKNNPKLKQGLYRLIDKTKPKDLKEQVSMLIELLVSMKIFDSQSKQKLLQYLNLLNVIK